MPYDKNDRRKATIWRIAQGIIPAIALAMLSWIALQIVDVKTDIPVIKLTVATIQKDLLNHNLETKEMSQRNSVLHHRTTVHACVGCHI